MALACGAKTYKMRYGNRYVIYSYPLRKCAVTLAFSLLQRNEPAVHRSADHTVLHHVPEPRVCGGPKLVTVGLAPALHQRERHEQ